jgi:ABC-type phosphate/phosphonate transport system substrate-binding protein
MADKSAFIRIVMIKWLADNGLKAGRDYTILERPTHSASVGAVTMNEADAGLATLTGVKQMPMDIQRQLRSLGIGLRFPHLFTMVNQRVGEDEIRRIRTALLDFPNRPEGRKFMADTGFLGYEEISREEIRQLQPYVELFQQMSVAR